MNSNIASSHQYVQWQCAHRGGQMSEAIQYMFSANPTHFLNLCCALHEASIRSDHGGASGKLARHRERPPTKCHLCVDRFRMRPGAGRSTPSCDDLDFGTTVCLGTHWDLWLRAETRRELCARTLKPGSLKLPFRQPTARAMRALLYFSHSGDMLFLNLWMCAGCPGRLLAVSTEACNDSIHRTTLIVYCQFLASLRSGKLSWRSA
ncbi:hypothetical protein DFH11DRAFT_1636642 [Phellopilus nigrolimitatus]|nr:hypothetical protein DFH11DRAFT_1636642 [Phellopilus nigrolimitatus]